MEDREEYWRLKRFRKKEKKMGKEEGGRIKEYGINRYELLYIDKQQDMLYSSGYYIQYLEWNMICKKSLCCSIL